MSLHTDAVVVDTHNDLLMLCARRPREQQAAYFRERWLPQLRAGGVDVQVLPVYIDDDFRPEGALRQTLRMLETGWTVAAGNADSVALCLTGPDVDAALHSGRIALVLALEGCEAVGTHVELFGALYRMGVRMASFTHFGRTALADGSGEDDTGGRLTRAGVEAVAVCEELGILLDVSHLGAHCTDHLLSLATRPVVASHSAAYALRPHHRNLTDERLRAIAAGGGVIGVNFFAGYVDPDVHTVARVVDHVEHVASVAGVDHTGPGPDFIHEVYAELMPLATEILMEGVDAKRLVPGLEGPEGLPLVTDELVARGWSSHDVGRVLGGAFLDLFRAELGVPLSERSRPTP